MRVFTSVAEVPSDFGPSAVTIGKFDGVHLGHHRMIDRMLAEARAESLVPTVLTFDRNPLSILAPAKCPPALVSNDQKLELLAACGVEATLMVTFDRELSEVSAEEFVDRVVVETLGAKIVYSGPDFRFGHGGKGDIALLEQLGPRHGFEVRRLAAVEHEGRRVSSTWVRELLSAGSVREAGTLLGRSPSVRGTVIEGARRGRTLGFPTANLAPDPEGFIPDDGVYAAWATVDGRRYPAAVSIGNNPTFEGVPARQVEAHLLAVDSRPVDSGPVDSGPVDLELYGKRIELGFVERIRGMERFETVEELVGRITEDVRAVRTVLGQARALP